MTLKEIYPIISSNEISLFDKSANKVHVICPESIKTMMSTIKTLSDLSEYEVIRIIPLDFSKIQITIKKRDDRIGHPLSFFCTSLRCLYILLFLTVEISNPTVQHPHIYQPSL